MAHTFLKADQIVSAGLGVLEREIVLPRLIATDAQQHFSASSPLNDTVSIRVDGRTKARDYEWRTRSAAIQVDDLNEFKVDVKLDTHVTSAVELTDEQMTLDITDFTAQVSFPQMRAVAERLEDKIAAGIAGADYGDNEIAITGSFYDSLIEARRILNSHHVPQQGRILIVGSSVEAEALKEDQFKNAGQAGDNSALRTATLGTVAGFQVVICNSIDPDEAYAYHPSAFQGVWRAPVVPRGVAAGATASHAGLSMRWIQDYDSDYLRDRSIYSSFFGFSVVEDPEDYSDSGSEKSLKRAVKLSLGADEPVDPEDP